MRAALVLTGLIAATAASAAECRQDHAIYADRDGGYELTFQPVGSDAAATSHHFKLKILASGLVLDGIVMPGDPARSNGMIMHDCPEGDVTGAEIAACTVWEGVLYALDVAGEANLVPDQGAKAAQSLLLSGFGPSLRYSALWDQGKAKVVPQDVFRQKGCAA
nr:hypothetical protein [uncultured Shinella sp.]